MNEIAIVAIAYNRYDSLKRLLSSITAVDYKNDNVDLIISIDNSGDTSIEQLAKGFKWNFGEKIIRTFNERQGLKKHILSCGEYLNKYDALIILEDDVYVSPAFYNFAKQAVARYYNNDNIAGISLYSRRININNLLTFNPLESSFDTYFMQFPQSWGQVWMKNQWQDFMTWYKDNSDEFYECAGVPKTVSHWSKSWLKYHTRYCVEKNKYFVYPYVSLTTCFVDKGEHVNNKVSLHQISMQLDCKKKYVFPDWGDKSAVKYDVFFENENMGEYLGIYNSDLCVNLYGTKDYCDKRYLLTTKSMNKKIIRSFALDLIPHEANIIFNIEGNDIFLYDMNVDDKNNEIKDLDVKLFRYHYKLFGKTKIMCKCIKESFFRYVRSKLHI